MKEGRGKTGLQDAVKVVHGMLESLPVTVAVQDFHFMGGSLGMAAGEAIIAAVEAASSARRPLILFASTGGARMPEGSLSLMQLPRTTVADLNLRDANLPYILVLTYPL